VAVAPGSHKLGVPYSPPGNGVLVAQTTPFQMQPGTGVNVAQPDGVDSTHGGVLVGAGVSVKRGVAVGQTNTGGSNTCRCVVTPVQASATSPMMIGRKNSFIGDLL
jgi:hypothetical protein